MNGGRTDASTSTDDVKGRPLCLFYFTHPFGVLSPEPPTVTSVAAAAPHVVRTFLDMQPVPSSDEYAATSSSRPAFDLGATTVHRSPVRLLRNYALDFGGDSGSSSLFSGDVWFSSGSSRSCGERRVVPYSRILPPLRLPTPRDLAEEGSDDVWPRKCTMREKFSLPPIEMPCSMSGLNAVSEVDLERVVSGCGSESLTSGMCCRRKPTGRRRRARLSGVQRMVTCLMRRNTKDHLMGYIFDNCPAVHECCFGVPLRPAAVVIAGLGLVWGCAYLFLFSGVGASAAQDAGLPADVAKGMRYVHGLLGILLLAVNVVLLAAAAYESDSLCEVYLWFMVLLWAVMLVSTATVALYAVVAGKLTFAGAYFMFMFCALLLVAYFMVVVGNYRMTLP